MACLSRKICSACLFSTSTGSVLGRRYLFSNEILGTENFKRISIFEKDRLIDKAGLIEKLDHSLRVQTGWNKRAIHDLIKLIYITDKVHGVPLITNWLRQLYCTSEASVKSDSPDDGNLLSDGHLSPRQFDLGPLVFRLLHILKDTDTAQTLYDDKELRPLFCSMTCHLLLMDMLYEAGYYQDVVNTFTALQHAEVSVKFPPDCTTLALGALYQMNTKESCHAMRRLVEEAKSGDWNLSRRSLLFATALALRQGDAAFALDVTKSVLTSNEPTFRNAKLMALAQLGRVEEAVVTIEDGLRGQISTPSRTCTVYSDTLGSLTDHVHSASNKPSLKAKFECVMSMLECEGLLSSQTMEYFVCRPILRQRRPKVSQSFKTRLKSPVKTKQKELKC